MPTEYGSSQARGKLEMKLLAYGTAGQIPAMSATYTIAHGNAGSLTHWAGPGMEPETSWILVGFITSEPQQELSASIYFAQTFPFFTWWWKFSTFNFFFFSSLTFPIHMYVFFVCFFFSPNYHCWVRNSFGVFLFVLLLFCFRGVFLATPMGRGSSRARDQTRTTAVTNDAHCNDNTRSLTHWATRELQTNGFNSQCIFFFFLSFCLFFGCLRRIWGFPG